MTLTQRLNFLIVLFAIFGANIIANPSAQATEAAGKPIVPSKKTPEAAFSDGLNCLKASNVACAQMTLIYIPSQSANAKVLSGGLAVLQDNDDLAFRLLLPLEADTTLQPAARASLHASLSLAYEKLPDSQRAVEQRVLEEQALIASNTNPAAVMQTQTKLWALISNLDKAQLIALRGASTETSLQGWVDLALAHLAESSATAIADWQKAYPDHSANAFALNLLQTTPIAKKNLTHQSLKGSVALLLPQKDDRQATTVLALQRGFTASAAIDSNTIEIHAYTVTSQDITDTYDLAINDGANYIIIANQANAMVAHPFTVPTLMLNAPSQALTSKNLYIMPQLLNDEALLLANTAHEFGMQNVLIVAQDSTMSERMSAAFNETWQQISGQTAKSIKISDDSNLLDVKGQISTQQADMVLMTGDASFARKIRPYLDIATPTFSFSPIYEGAQNPLLDASLNAIRFTDMPWLLKPAKFSAYQTPATEIAQDAISQRWFALGADAYRILTILNEEPITPASFNGLTGTIHIGKQGEITREPSLGSFTNNGVVLEK